MGKKKNPHSQPAREPAQTPVPAPLSGDLTTAEILAASPKKPRRGRIAVRRQR